MAELRRFVRGLTPAPLRRFVRGAVEEAPRRIRDFLPDLADRLRKPRGTAPLPPARLRRRVGATCSREDFLTVGQRCAGDFLAAFEKVRPAGFSDRRWLDFGCGCGRVARHLAARLPGRELWGVDVDREAVRWASTHLPGRFEPIPARPPTALPEGHFDVALAGSVFTHLPEAAQQEWLAELVRVLRPGGLLLATTHGPELTWSRPDIPPGELEKLGARGFLFAPGGGPFSEDSAFHSLDYLRRTWGPRLTLELFLPRGLTDYQDLSVWRKA